MNNFTETLNGTATEPNNFFDPAEASQSSDESSNEQVRTPEGPSMFKKRAATKAARKESAARKKLDVSYLQQPQKLSRTRSQTKSLSEPDKVFEVGQQIMANKGRKVPFWFPGMIAMPLAKGGYRVDFLDVFGSEDCRKENVITVAEFETKKLTEGKTKLFKVPEKYVKSFTESFEKLLQ